MAHTTTASGALALLNREAVDFAFFREGLFELLSVDEAEVKVSRHTSGFTQLVLETAARSTEGNETSVDVKTFASYFIGKPPAYSRTLAGKSALLFETWLVEKGGGLFERFVETVLESPTQYRAVFTG